MFKSKQQFKNIENLLLLVLLHINILIIHTKYTIWYVKIGPYDYHKKFPCCLGRESRYFTKLMYLIIAKRNNTRMDTRECVKHLRKKKNRSKINHQNEEGWTALIIAATNVDICQLSNS